MAYRFKLDEPLQKGVRRIAHEQMERVADHLRSVTNAAVEADAAADARAKHIHEARKCIKRTRALLRLVRAGLSLEMFVEENAMLKAIAASIAGERERVSLEAAVAWLAPVIEDPRAIRALRASVPQTSGVAGPESGPDPGSAEAAASRLVALDVEGSGLEVIEAGLARCHRQCRRAYAQAIETGDGEAFHEWRKTVQWHWRHMQLLSPAWPQFCAARLESARRVSQLLGDDHDLTQLIALVRSADLSKPARSKIAKVIEARQTKLRAAATLDGQRLLADRPKALARLICAYWRAAGGSTVHI
jgi:CHAD domain-containing protein